MKGMQGHAREGGAASFLAVALMLVLTLLGLVCLLFARNSRLMAAEHLREIQLELAAEGVLDRVRCEVCRQPDFLRTGDLQHLYDEKRDTPGGSLVMRANGKRTAGCVEVTAVAYEAGDSYWQRHREVTGIFVEKEEGYVWVGRVP
ncbi:hypothetical protein [Mitsuokella sp.]|uniref:hypothetical protein n=1 Tax=Mitsuokella sp. TaxID=2049034 RepID=UPI0029E38820|nr:hypothetical protein [Mitsuokella sp.]MDD6381774.1 hypothetical protein [Selenomonadaceae bacterium]MDY4474562.1 hypothetical protein [Mitsuokella sp.]